MVSCFLNLITDKRVFYILFKTKKEVNLILTSIFAVHQIYKLC